MLLSSGTNPYVEQGRLVAGVVPYEDDKDVNFPDVDLARPAHVTRPPVREAIVRVDSRGLLRTVSGMFSCVNHWYQLPFRLHSNTWKTTNLTHCLVNTRKYRPRRNLSVGKAYSVFVTSSTWIANAKSVHKMHFTIFHVGKTQKAFYGSSQFTVTVTSVDNDSRSVNVLDSAVRMKDGHAQCTGNKTRNRYSTWKPQEDHTFLSPLSP